MQGETDGFSESMESLHKRPFLQEGGKPRGRSGTKGSSDSWISPFRGVVQKYPTRNKRIFDLWMACHTQEEIAEREGVSQGEVSKSIPNGNIADWNKSDQSKAEFADDFEIPIYNVWKFKKKSNKSVPEIKRDLEAGVAPGRSAVIADLLKKALKK